MQTSSIAQRRLVYLTATATLAWALSACGGGGGSGTGSSTGSSASTGAGDTSTTSTSTLTVPAGTTLVSPNYAASSAQLQIFNTINGYRQLCGFPAYQQNTILDQAAQNHAAYMIANGSVITDLEVSGNVGYTGVTGLDRALALGWTKGLWVGAADTGATYTNAVLTQAQYGQSMVDAWSVGVYHQATIAFPANLIGVGVAQTTLNGFPEVLGGVEIANSAATAANITTQSNSPLTFPCQGVTGVPYKGVAEMPTPPNTAGSWGTPVTVMGNPSDVVTLTSATMIASGSSTVINLNILTSANDTTTLIGKYQAVAYPTTSLEPNTTYSVNLAGTVNGVGFSRSFTFTTGNTVG